MHFFTDNQEQSPAYPHGDGDCGAPNCYCGSNVPCGFYVWNHSSTTVVHGQTFRDWFKDSYIFDYQGSSPLVSGFYFDDWSAPRCGPGAVPPRVAISPRVVPCVIPSARWPASGGFPDPYPHMVDDMGLTPEEQARISKAYVANMAVICIPDVRGSNPRTSNCSATHTSGPHTGTDDELIKRGMFSWQQQWNGQSDPTAKNGCCTRPLVNQGSTCAPTLRKLCAADSPAQTRVLNYAFTPGGCGTDPKNLTDPIQDIANFLLVRGPHAFLGHGWLGCSRECEPPPSPTPRPCSASSPCSRASSRGVATQTRCPSSSTGTTASPPACARRPPPTAASSPASGPRRPFGWTAIPGRQRSR